MSIVHTVGISDCVVSNDPRAVLTTHALGSCIGMAIYDPIAGIAGLLHFMLPDSGSDRDRSHERPFMYADTGIPLLFRTAYSQGASKQRLLVSALGGAQVMSGTDSFNIGKRNCLEMRKILWKAGVMIHAEDLGGTAPRTVRLEVSSGRVLVSSGGAQRELQSMKKSASVGLERNTALERSTYGR